MPDDAPVIIATRSAILLLSGHTAQPGQRRHDVAAQEGQRGDQ